MKKTLFAFVVLAAAALFAGQCNWMTNFEAAQKVSREKNLPMMLDFTGSDWCFWCKVMDRQVFAEKKWNEWAKKNLVCVALDFPRGDDKLSPKIKKQNETLMKKYGVRGFPTFVLLSAGGESEIGRAGCPGRDATPEMFIDAVKKIISQPVPAVK